MLIASPTRLDSLLALLSSELGWRRLERSRPVESEPHHSTWSIAMKREARLLVWEGGVGQPMPTYRARRQEWSRVAGSPRDIVVFTDAAHARFVWSHLAGFVGGPRGYEEYHLPGDLDALRQALRRRPRRGIPTSDNRAGACDLLQKLTPSLAPGLWPPELAEAELPLKIGDTDDPATLRALWSVLDSVVVVEAACASGNWLLGAADALEILFRVAIGRMRAFMGDAVDRGDRRRPEHLSDFRRIAGLAASDGRRGVSYLRQRIAQRHLYGFASAAADAARVRRTLVAWAGFPPGSATALDTNIRRMGGSHLRTNAANEWLANCSLPAIAGSLQGEMEIIGGAWALVAQSRLEDDWLLSEWRTAASQLELRRRSIEARWRRDIARREDTPDSPMPSVVSFPSLHRRARSIVVTRAA